MARCRYCKIKVSYRAKSCPKCGEPNPGRLPPRPTAESDPPLLFSLIFTLTCLIATYIGWQTGGFLRAAGYFIVGGILGIVVGWKVQMAISLENEEKLNQILGLGLLAFILWLIFW